MARLLLPLAVLAAAAQQLAADSDPRAFSPTALFGDHMVLQATDPSKPDESAHLAGQAAPGAVVVLEVAFGGKTEKTLHAAADSSGQWDIGGIKATMNQGPFVLTLRAMGQARVAKDVWFGTVVMCTGQSNMELSFPDIYDNETLINSATTPEIRLLQVKLSDAAAPLPVGAPVPTVSNWTLASPRTVKTFSAICYLTARAISDRIMCEAGACYFGLIETCEGATDIQSWMSAESREEARTSCWAMPGQAPPPQLPPIAIGKHGGPAQLYNAMIAPLAGYTLAGIWWDQGEDNDPYCSAHQYDCLYQTMMTDWRAKWNQSASSLPVTSVQLCGFNRGMKVANIRLAQSDSLPTAQAYWSNHSKTRIALPNSAVAASYDLCSPEPGKEQTPGQPGYACWVHARNKSEVSRRVALQHLQLLGQTGGDQWSGPVVLSTTKSPASPVRFRLKNVDFRLKNVAFRLKNVDFMIKRTGSSAQP